MTGVGARLVPLTMHEAALAGLDVVNRWAKAPDDPTLAVYDVLDDHPDWTEADTMARAVVAALGWEPPA